MICKDIDNEWDYRAETKEKLEAFIEVIKAPSSVREALYCFNLLII